MGLTSVKGFLIALGRVDYSYSGLLCPHNTQHQHETWKEWGKAFQDLQDISSLQKLQVWLWHRNTEESDLARRPWKEELANEAVEQKHQKLFDVLGAVVVPDFTVNLTWKPDDLLSQREWPFKFNLQTARETSRLMSELPEPTEPDLYD